MVNRIEAYLTGAKEATTPQQLLESMAQLFKGTSQAENTLVRTHLQRARTSKLPLSEEEELSLESMLEQRRQGDPAAIVGVYLLLIRVILLGVGDVLDHHPV